MPEFILDLGSADGVKSFETLDEFTQGYVEAMFFTSTGYREDDELHHATFAELAPDTLDTIKRDCASFKTANADDLDKATANASYCMSRAGHDFWYSRNGHGVGYCDRQLGDVSDRLHKAAKACGGYDLYRGDDGLIYLM